MEKVVLTYGTFDLFHSGHLKLLARLKKLGTKLIVGVSTDEFNAGKGKKTIIPFQDRISIVENIKHVDLAIPEENWEQKVNDIKKYNVNIFGMGHDWEGKFDHLRQWCEVIYLPRTNGISSTEIKNSLKALDQNHIKEIKKSLDLISSIIEKLD
ncbi:glycerol-3-phosphate cytidylyltransferase [Pseudomonas citronellolis]|uniref:adenylyltransferase/cytidyltransferase family protein n=1 Tax=Pseudomonas citronellolis TaxID=53408 RepID=UPI00209E43D7|nr:adenylyltransferase/cytidyltransferase family protein [Pseudomonas citronellolis]MCP1641863.1 glycerol-3-phosphate cytidylyltransferase [Pseudomonas citronellolis]MCP1664781.1 glycerol-3-phosphate cytidylyltransferase [Pseudomonas citronellolis]MCP1695760.1 glycerol-3-phosphate cytidylyltransferase [Pseudomonas citronellolis]MCP1702617.1 glycerol-3-phosphate cytidylyltransferase [Pseudomonas citronellolis]MCP1796502.1 glycerol-3-phosphate cytidylyltransferase [Pseudomonas citronellolis]